MTELIQIVALIQSIQMVGSIQITVARRCVKRYFKSCSIRVTDLRSIYTP